MTTDEFRDATLLNVPRDGVPPVINADIDAVANALAQGHGPFAVDTERAMGIRYSNRAYLIQIRRAGAGTFLIDPVGVEDQFAELARVMNDEWILHSASQDLPSLRELGLEPASVFDTELAGLILGCERVSLQAMIAHILGFLLAKEHSQSDWSARPLHPDLLTYAALDVELLIELRAALIDMLESAGRREWHRQECEYIRLATPKPAHPEPWRKAARGIHDPRALAMLRELWETRDELARRRDLAPTLVLSNKDLGALAAAKPRSRADVANSRLLRSLDQQRDIDVWWDAVRAAWHLGDHELPARRYEDPNSAYPATQKWSSVKPEAAARLTIIRNTVDEHAEKLGIRHDVLLKPAIHKLLAWQGWEGSDVDTQLRTLGARPWQIARLADAISHAAAQLEQ